jgi:hypothetical protein
MGTGEGNQDERDSPAGAVLRTTGTDHAREMYRRFLESEYPDALAMAEEVLRERPDDVMAQAIAGECRAALARPLPPTVPAPPMSSAPPRDSEAPTTFRLPEEEATPPYMLVTRSQTSHSMCQRFLDSDHPAALALAEAVLKQHPEDRIARAIAEQCRAALDTVRADDPPEAGEKTEIALPPETPRG